MMNTDFPNLRAVLEEYAVALRNAYQDNLIRSERIATGGLLNSIEARVSTDGDGVWTVSLILAEWWKWVEDDTRPHWPPPGALIPWIRAKPVIPRPDDRGRIPSEKSLDYLIRRKIAKEGTRGTHDLENAENALQAEWMPRIQRALIQDASEGLRVYIIETFRDLNPAPVEI